MTYQLAQIQNKIVGLLDDTQFHDTPPAIQERIMFLASEAGINTIGPVGKLLSYDPMFHALVPNDSMIAITACKVLDIGYLGVRADSSERCIKKAVVGVAL